MWVGRRGSEHVTGLNRHEVQGLLCPRRYGLIMILGNCRFMTSCGIGRGGCADGLAFRSRQRICVTSGWFTWGVMFGLIADKIPVGTYG